VKKAESVDKSCSAKGVNMLSRKVYLALIPSLLLNIVIGKAVMSAEICVKNAQGIFCGEIVNTKKGVINSTKTNKVLKVSSSSGVDFILESCKKSNIGLNCSFTIVNSSDFDRQVGYSISRFATIIDSEGNSYEASSAANVLTIGNNVSGDLNGYRSAILPPKVKVKSNMSFMVTGNLTDQIKILSITHMMNGISRTITFRDFSIKK
jgi:hypothetical protein